MTKRFFLGRVALVLSLLAASASLAAPADAHGFGCRAHLGSDASTTWTRADAVGPAAALEPSVVVTSRGTVVPREDSLVAPKAIWARTTLGEDPGERAEPTVAPITFAAPVFGGCGTLPYYGTLSIAADDSYVAYVNGAPVAECGTGPALVLNSCFGTYQKVHVLLRPGPNVVVVHAWNAANYGGVLQNNGAFLQFLLSY